MVTTVNLYSKHLQDLFERPKKAYYFKFKYIRVISLFEGLSSRFESYLIKKSIKINLQLRGILYDIHVIDKKDAEILISSIGKGLEGAIQLEETFIENIENQQLKTEIENMIGLLEEIQEELNFIINPTEYEESIELGKKSFKQLSAIKKGLIKPKTFDSIIN